MSMLPEKWERLRRLTESMPDRRSAAGIRGDVLLELLADFASARADLRDSHAADDDLLTPILDGTNYRLHLRVQWLDGESSRGPGIKGHVMDQDTYQTFRIEGRPCSLTHEDGSGCYCDATAIPVTRPVTTRAHVASTAPEGTDSR